MTTTDTNVSRGHFATKLGIILATAGSSVGLGNIWRFPVETGENGGAAFILVYLLCVIFLGVPMMTAEFIIGRPNDNIGLAIFAGESFTQCPMTTDHQSLLNLLQNVRTDIAARGLIEDGTAIGMGLANAVSRLK